MCCEQRQRDELRTQDEQAALSQHPKNFKSKIPCQRKCAETYQQKKTRAPERGRAEMEEGKGGETSALNFIF